MSTVIVLVITSLASFVGMLVSGHVLINSWREKTIREVTNNKAIEDNTASIREVSLRVARIERHLKIREDE